MKKTLISHTSIDDIAVVATLTMGKSHLIISFDIRGVLEKYAFPKEERIQRENELWKDTCFELFLANSKKDDYYELNFSPSLAWNFYSLQGYRVELKELTLRVEPRIKVDREQGHYEIRFELEGLDLERFDSCNISAILLTQEGVRTFWSILPMKGSPDFHNRAYFMNLKTLIS